MAVQRMPREAFCLMAAAVFMAGAQTIVGEMILLRLATRYTGSAADGTTVALSLYLLGLLAGSALVLKLNQPESNPKLNSDPACSSHIRPSFRSYISSVKNSLPQALLPTTALIALAVTGPILANLSRQKALPPMLLPAIVFLPALLAGAVFPIIMMLSSRFYFGGRSDFDPDGAVINTNRTNMLLYLLSNLGSAAGAIGSALWFLPAFGIAHTLAYSSLIWLTILLLLSPFIAAPLVAKRVKAKPLNTDQVKVKVKEEKEEEGEFIDAQAAVVSVNRPFTYTCVMAAALVGLLFECLAIRLLSLVCGASFITTTCAITATLLAIAIGARLALLIPGGKNMRLTMAMAISLAALGLALSLLLLPHLVNIFQALRQLAGHTSAQASLHARSLAYLYPRLLLALTLCLPGATGLSLLFPLAARGASRPDDILRLYIAGGIGTALAPALYYLAMGRLILPHVESTMELLLRLTIIALVALTIVGLGRQWRKRNSTSADFFALKIFTLLNTATTAAILFFLPPLDVSKIDLGLSFVPSNLSLKEIVADARSTQRLFYREGRTATISVLANATGNAVILRSDGKVEGTIPDRFREAAPNSDLSTQLLLALLPALWRNQDAHSYFLIGYGTGTTMATLASLNADGKARIETKEIEPAVLDAARYFERNAKILAASQKFASATTGDARQALTDQPQSYDAIISQPAEPWVQGSTNLYSSEFYTLVKKRLNQSGSFCQWLQLYGLDEKTLHAALKTFQAVFPDCLVFHQPGAGEILLLGFNGPAPSKDTAAIRTSFLRKDWRELFALAGIDSFSDLQNDIILESSDLAKLLKDADASSNVRLVTDDNLALELALMPEIESAGEHIEANLHVLQNFSRTSVNPDQIAANFQKKSAVTDPASVSDLNARALKILAKANGQEPRGEAQALIDESLRLNPNRSDTHMLRALLLLQEGKAPQALKEADIAHRLNLADSRPFIIAAAALYLAGDKEEALTKINKARQIVPHGVLLKEVEWMEDHLAGPLPTLESKTYADTLASRLTRLLEEF
ncbi:MAG: fused MFS/spermidine synthase [Cyanobacteria bacterium REEB67]|nr:fused MFS/spermidine synthase [Cyanobacteria bacterium REEB67]